MPNIQDAISGLGRSFLNLPLNRKIALVGVLVILAATSFALFVWLNKPNYQVLYSQLSPESGGAIIDKLKEEKIPYQLKHNGSTILVPDNQVHELRLNLATQGILQRGTVGFELFDQTNLGTTEFVQGINYQRALQGELGRTISSLAEIEWARVHLVMPQKSLFVEEEQPTTASVVIKLKPGARLRKDQISGIVNLLSCSVEGLLTENIKIIDDQGLVLNENQKDLAEQMLQIAKMEYQNRTEEMLEKKVTTMLEKALGENKAIARVSVLLNLKRVESTEEKYDPDRTVVKTEQRTQENAQGQTAVTPESGTDSNYQKADETINYELSKAVNHILELPGQITRLSVAVMVDGTYNKKDKGAVEYIPRTPEEMKSIRAIVEKAAGYDLARGDQIEVVNIPFHGQDVEADRTGLAGLGITFWLSMAKYAGKVLLVLFIFLFLFRPLLKWLYSFAPPPPEETTSEAKVEEAMPQLGDSEEAMINEIQGNLPQRVDKLEMALKTAGNEESKALENLVGVIREIAKQEPKRIAQLTHEWLQEERKQT